MIAEDSDAKTPDGSLATEMARYGKRPLVRDRYDGRCPATRRMPHRQEGAVTLGAHRETAAYLH